MRRFSFNDRAKLILVTMFFIAASLLPARWADAVWGNMAHVTFKAVSPFTHQLKRLADTLRPARTAEIAPDYRLDLQERRYFEQRVEQLEQENAELRGLRGQFTADDVRFIKGLVTFWSGTTAAPTITINRGEREGVQVGDIATHGVQLVGRVVKVERDLAAIGLISRTGATLSVRIVPPPGQDISPRDVRTSAVAVEGSQQFVAIVPMNDPVRVGDVAHLADESYPHQVLGAVVGVVRAIEPKPEDPTLWNRVIIEPTTQLHRVDRVWLWVIGER